MESLYLFRDREDAGQKLGRYLKELHLEAPVVLGLPRGGVVLADEVARILECPLSTVIARKIGEPYNREYGIGALSEDLVPHFNEQLQGLYDFQSSDVLEVIAEEQEELRRRVQLYRHSRPVPLLDGKTAIVVDDGLATGVTAFAAGKFLRTRNPAKLILAVPVGPTDISRSIQQTYDDIHCLHALSNLRGVGLWYENFDQVEDDEVLQILKNHGGPEGAAISAD